VVAVVGMAVLLYQVGCLEVLVVVVAVQAVQQHLLD
jgi:hypothetical protein